MRRLAILLLALPLVGCTSLAGSFEDMMNPQGPVLGADESSPEAPPLTVLTFVEDVGLVLSIDPPGITLGRRRVVLTGARGTTNGDAVAVSDITDASIVGSSVVELGTTASVTPTSPDTNPEDAVQ